MSTAATLHAEAARLALAGSPVRPGDDVEVTADGVIIVTHYVRVEASR